jgi:hypothetical protein
MDVYRTRCQRTSSPFGLPSGVAQCGGRGLGRALITLKKRAKVYVIWTCEYVCLYRVVIHIWAEYSRDVRGSMKRIGGGLLPALSALLSREWPILSFVYSTGSRLDMRLFNYSQSFIH